MPAPRAAVLAAALFTALSAPLPASAADDPLAPTGYCQFGDVYKVVGYGGFAYTSGSVVPRRLTLICQWDNGEDRHITRQTVEGPVVAIASHAATSVPDSATLCMTAIAEYVGGHVATTSHCTLLVTAVRGLVPPL